MIEHPRLFSAEMVRAILDGPKTQTRRVVKPQPLERETRCSNPFQWNRVESVGEFFDIMSDNPLGVFTVKCPYGNAGDRLWVRETWRLPVAFDEQSPTQVADKALDAGYRRPWAPIKFEVDGRMDNPHLLKDFGGAWGKTRVSIHMPRWASRITLEITGVRVERLNAITTEDAIAEGIDSDGGDDAHRNRSSVENFRHLWESINGKGSWATNPWVWVVSFKQVQP